MKINNQSDFKIKEVTKNEDFNVRFRFEFFVYEFKKYVVSWDGKEYVNCKRLDDGSLEIIFNNPKFGLGQLKVRREYYISDEDFIDGIWNAVTLEKTGIYITDGETDDIDVENVIVPPYIKGEPGKDMKWSTMTQDEKDELINDLGEGINNSFVEAETTRNNNEELRKTSESARVTAEQGRVEAELKRGTDFDTLKSEMQTAIDEGKAATKETIEATEGLDAIVEEQNAKLTELGSKVGDTVSLWNTFSTKPIGRNLFNKETLAYNGDRCFISTLNGEVVKNEDYELFVSHLIPLKSGQSTITIHKSIGNKLSSTQGYRFLDVVGKIVSYGNMSNYNYITIDIPSNAAYFQFSTTKDDGIIVEYGSIDEYNFEKFIYSEELEEAYKNSVETKLALSGSNNLLSNVWGKKHCFIGSAGEEVFAAEQKYDMFLFNPIPLKEETDYIVGSIKFKESLTGGGYYAIYNEDFAPIEVGRFDINSRAGDNYWEFTTPINAKYLRFAVSYFDKNSDVFLFEGSWESVSNADLFVVNGDNLKYSVPSVNAENITDTKNLFDSSVQSVEDRRFIDPTTGETTLAPLYDVFISTLMAVSYAKKYLTVSCSTAFSSSTGWRFFSKNMEVISYGNMGMNGFITIKIPIGAAYFQFSTSRNRANIQVEYGKEATEYSSYKGVASTHYVDYKVLTAIPPIEETKIYLPDTLVFTKNRKQTLYSSNFINKDVWSPANIQIFGNGVNSYYGKTTICNIQSNTNLTIKHYKSLVNDCEKVVSAISVDQTRNRGKNVKIMCLGDSYTEISYWVEALKNNLSEDGVNVKLIGAMHSVRNGINLNVSTENQTGGTIKGSFMSKVSGKCYVVNVSGVSEKNMPINYSNYVTYNSNGYTWTVWGYDLDEAGNGKMRLYCSNSSAVLLSSGNLTKVGGIGDSSISYSGITEVNKNPFWNIGTNALDVEGINLYFSTWGFEKPDILVLQFMWNDLPNSATDSQIEVFISNLKTFIGLFRESIGSELPIIFSIEPSAPANTGQNYDANGRKSTVLNLAEHLYAAFSDDVYTHICPSFAFVDGEHAFGSKEVVVSNRFAEYKEVVSTDSVHPIQGGMYQIGDAVTPYVHYIISEG